MWEHSLKEFLPAAHMPNAALDAFLCHAQPVSNRRRSEDSRPDFVSNAKRRQWIHKPGQPESETAWLFRRRHRPEIRQDPWKLALETLPAITLHKRNPLLHEWFQCPCGRHISVIGRSVLHKLDLGHRHSFARCLGFERTYDPHVLACQQLPPIAAEASESGGDSVLQRSRSLVDAHHADLAFVSHPLQLASHSVVLRAKAYALPRHHGIKHKQRESGPGARLFEDVWQRN